jgi:hypothetical protein
MTINCPHLLTESSNSSTTFQTFPQIKTSFASVDEVFQSTDLFENLAGTITDNVKVSVYFSYDYVNYVSNCAQYGPYILTSKIPPSIPMVINYPLGSTLA